MRMDTKTTTQQLGVAAIAERLGVTENAVREATRSGLYPAMWWKALRGLAAERGVDLPDNLFRWKSA